MRMKKRRRRLRHYQTYYKPGENIHHIMPRSRGGSNSDENTVLIDHQIHENYHQLFGNMTPPEIICYLVNYFWKGQLNWLYEVVLRGGGKIDEVHKGL